MAPHASMTPRGRMLLPAVVALWVGLLMSVAPGLAQQTAAPSTWSRIVGGAKGLVRDPLKRSQAADEGVKQATWNEPAPKVSAAESRGAKTAKARPKSSSLFSRAPRAPARTISEYMAQERP